MDSIGVGQWLCNDFYCDCEFCESFGVPEGRRERFMASFIEPGSSCDLGYATGVAQGRLGDGVGKGQDQQVILDKMREEAKRLVGADDAAECVFQYVLGFMIGLGKGTQEADWDQQEEEWRASGGYWLDQDL